MRRAFLCAVLMMVCASSAFGGATEELLKAAADKNTTPRMIENLIKAGANVNAKDNKGKTALDYAKKNEKVKRIILDATK